MRFDPLRSGYKVVRPPKVPISAFNAKGAWKLAVVTRSSNFGRANSYTVDIYGKTYSSLFENATAEGEIATQEIATRYFYNGELVAVRQLGADWQIEKLTSSPLAGIFQSGQLCIRPFGSSSSNTALLYSGGVSTALLDEAMDYTAVMALFDAAETAQTVHVIGHRGGVAVFGLFYRANLVPFFNDGSSKASIIASAVSAVEADYALNLFDVAYRPDSLAMSGTYAGNPVSESYPFSSEARAQSSGETTVHYRQSALQVGWHSSPLRAEYIYLELPSSGSGVPAAIVPPRGLASGHVRIALTRVWLTTGSYLSGGQVPWASQDQTLPYPFSGLSKIHTQGNLVGTLSP